MRTCTVLLCIAALLPVSGYPATPDSSTLLVQANQAFSAGKPVNSVELTGTAQWFAGSTKDSGPARLTAKVTGENRAEFGLSGGSRVEGQSAIGDDRTCTWSGKDGVVHEMASSNCWTATIWFLPHLALQSEGLPTALQIKDGAASVGKPSNSVHFQHSLHIAPNKTPSAVTTLIQSWSLTDLALDSATLLPSVLKYKLHPDNHSSIDIPVEVHYSNYKNVSGAELPMHIERYVNGSLQLSIDIESAVVN